MFVSALQGIVNLVPWSLEAGGTVPMKTHIETLHGARTVRATPSPFDGQVRVRNAAGVGCILKQNVVIEQLFLFYSDQDELA